MKKKLITTLLIGATLGAGISALSTSSVNACRPTRDVTIAHNFYGRENVKLFTHNGKFYKAYPSEDWCHTFFDVCDVLYCYNELTGKPQTGLLRNGSDIYYFDHNGKAITGDRIIDGHKYHFENGTYLGHMIY